MAESAPPPNRRVTAMPPNGKTATPPPMPQDMTPRKAAVIELLAIPQIPLVGLAAAEQARNPEGISVYALDIWAIQAYSEPLADAVVALANQYPVLGVLLDRMAVTAPILQLLSTGIALAAQIAENHAALPAGMRGISPQLIERTELADRMKKDAEERAAAIA